METKKFKTEVELTSYHDVTVELTRVGGGTGGKTEDMHEAVETVCESAFGSVEHDEDVDDEGEVEVGGVEYRYRILSSLKFGATPEIAADVVEVSDSLVP